MLETNNNFYEMFHKAFEANSDCPVPDRKMIDTSSQNAL